MANQSKGKSKKCGMLGEYVVVRSANAGCHVGILEAKMGDEVTLRDARRLWYWVGAASLSELAMRGVSKPLFCKFPLSVPRQLVMGVIEIIPATKEAQQSINGVPVWTGR